MASFLSKLFGLSGGGARAGEAATEASDPVEYEGFLIQAAPERAGDQWRLAGHIIKKHPDGDLTRTFLRADTFSARDEAENFAIRKAKQIIDEQGEKLFSSGEPAGRA